MPYEINDTAAARVALSENRGLQSELGSWSIDLTFCVRMLQIYGLKAEAELTKSRIEQSIHVANGFIEERIARLTSELKKEEVHLTKLAEDALLTKDREMNYKHQAQKKEVDQARKDFAGLRASLYGLISELKSI